MRKSAQKGPVMKIEEEESLVIALKEQISLERELEAYKIDLAAKPDFNLTDAFRMLDIEGKGWVTASEIKGGLEVLGLFADKQDVYLFLRRYDGDSDGRIRYSDFCEAFTPKDEYYADLLGSRKAVHIHHVLRRDEYFHADTREQLRIAWRAHLNVENAAEKLRQRLYRRPHFSAHDAFRTCDIDDNGYITRNELRSLLQNHGFSATEGEITWLLDRYDRNKDGRISYSEFIEEVTPKSPLK